MTTTANTPAWHAPFFPLPAQQAATPIATDLCTLLERYSGWSYVKETDVFLARDDNDHTTTFSVQTLAEIDRRLPGTIIKLSRRRNPEEIAYWLKESVRCWHSTLVLDFEPGNTENTLRSGYRVYIRAIEGLSTHPRQPHLASIRMQIYQIHEEASIALERKIPRGDVACVQIYAFNGVGAWAQLEEWWPGIKQQVETAEAIGLNPAQIAQLYISQSQQTHDWSAQELPDLPGAQL